MNEDINENSVVDLYSELIPNYNPDGLPQRQNVLPWTMEQLNAILMIKYKCDRRANAHMECYHFYKKLNALISQITSFILIIAGSVFLILLLAVISSDRFWGEIISSGILLMGGISIQINEGLDFNKKKEHHHRANIEFRNISGKIQQEVLLLPSNAMRSFDHFLLELNALYIKSREYEIPLSDSVCKKYKIPNSENKYSYPPFSSTTYNKNIMTEKDLLSYPTLQQWLNDRHSMNNEENFNDV